MTPAHGVGTVPPSPSCDGEGGGLLCLLFRFGVWYKHTNPTTFFAVVVLQEREEEELPARHGQCHQCVWGGGGGAVFFPGSSLFFPHRSNCPTSGDQCP